MALKIISYIFVVSLVFGITNPSQTKDVPFDVNEVIQKVNQNYRNNPKIPHSEFQIPDLESEFLIDTSFVSVAVPYGQENPAIAFDGTNYLVVWQDYRSSSSSDIYGARVSQSGTVLDPAGIAISTATNNQMLPMVAFDGTNYLVIWQDRRHGYTFDIYGTRVSQAGAVLDPAGLPISTAAHDQENPAIAFAGTNYLVVWDDSRIGFYSDIYGARVSQAGTVLDSNGIAISTATNYQVVPAIAFDGTNYLVAWADGRNSLYESDIYGARISQAGTVLDPNGIVISTATGYQVSPAIAFAGTNYLVVWTDGRSVSFTDIYGARVSQTGAVLDPAGLPISTAAYDQENPAIAFAGTNYLVVWDDSRNSSYSNIYGARISQAGTVLDPNGIAISTVADGQYSPAIAFDGTIYLVAWVDGRNSFYDIYGARVSQTGTVIDPNGFIVSTAANEQESPAITFDGVNYLVVWTDYRISTSDIYGMRVSQTGTLLDPTGISITTATDSQYSPSVAFDGINYLVVWTDERNGSKDIYGTRVSQDGIVLDPASIPISTAADNQYSPYIAFDGTNYLVVWSDERNYYEDIYGSRVSQNGIVLDPNGIAISTTIEDQFNPVVAFDGTNFLVVWEDWLSSDIYCARISQAGTVLDPNGIAVSTATGYQVSPTIAFDGTNYLVVWTDGRSVSFTDIYGARVSQAGTVLDPNGIVISTAANNQLYPALAFDGTNYLVVWQDYRNGSSYEIYGAQVSPSGALIDSFPVSTQEGNQESPTLAHGSGNQVLITYQGWTSAYQGRTYNTTRIWGKFYPFGSGIEEKNSEVKIQRTKFLEVYPNPATGVVRVRGPLTVKEAEEIKIFDVAGKVVREIATPSARNDKLEEIRIPLKGINPGIYFLEAGKETKKFVVTR